MARAGSFWLLRMTAIRRQAIPKFESSAMACSRYLTASPCRPPTRESSAFRIGLQRRQGTRRDCFQWLSCSHRAQRFTDLLANGARERLDRWNQARRVVRRLTLREQCDVVDHADQSSREHVAGSERRDFAGEYRLGADARRDVLGHFLGQWQRRVASPSVAASPPLPRPQRRAVPATASGRSGTPQ